MQWNLDQTTFFKCSLIQISLHFIPNGLIDITINCDLFRWWLGTNDDLVRRHTCRRSQFVNTSIREQTWPVLADDMCNWTFLLKHKNKQEHVGTPWPAWIKSVYESDVECRFLEFWVEMAKWPLRPRSMIPVFNTSWENPKMYFSCKFDFTSNPLQVIALTNQISYSQIINRTLKIKVNEPHYQYQSTVSQDACL